MPSEHPLKKLLQNSKNTICLKETEGNSDLKLFWYTLLTLLLPADSPSPNFSLFETIKCSLFSEDLDFSQNTSSGPSFDDLQGKAMMTRFLNYLTSTVGSNIERLHKGVALLEGNEILINLLVMFLRKILVKLDVEGADDFLQKVSFEVAIGNLLEFFDIPHNHLPYLFLLAQQNYFLAAANGEVFFGQFLSNLNLKN